MPPPVWARMVDSARDEATLAVRLYNDPHAKRSFEGFVIHMHVAWLYLLHARFARDGVDTRYRMKDHPARILRVDGEAKRWELTRCAEERWEDPVHPVRRNLEFFVGLRNRIEHRHSHGDHNLIHAVSGHSQALLLNFEEELTSCFGHERSMAATIRFPVFIGTFTAEGEEALRRLNTALPTDLQHFLAEYHDGLTENDSRFQLRMRVVLEQAKDSPDALSIQFTRWDDLTDAEKAVVARLGRRGQTIIREQKRSVVGHGLLRPTQAEQMVASAVPFVFNSRHFLDSWRRKGIRPSKGSPHPERTDERYCLYNELSGNYGYTGAWVKWLIKHCSSETEFVKTTGRPARPKESTSARVKA